MRLSDNDGLATAVVGPWPRKFRLTVGVLVGVLAAEVAYVFLRAMSLGWIGSAALAAVPGVLLGRFLMDKLGVAAPIVIRPAGFAVFASLAAVCAVQTARAGAFALDAQAREYAIQPWDEVTVHHKWRTAARVSGHAQGRYTCNWRCPVIQRWRETKTFRSESGRVTIHRRNEE